MKDMLSPRYSAIMSMSAYPDEKEDAPPLSRSFTAARSAKTRPRVTENGESPQVQLCTFVFAYLLQMCCRPVLQVAYLMEQDQASSVIAKQDRDPDCERELGWREQAQDQNEGELSTVEASEKSNVEPEPEPEPTGASETRV